MPSGAWRPYRQVMTSPFRRVAHLGAATVLSTAVLVGGAGASQADPPDDWTGGSRADWGRVTWIHDGWYPGAQGNWHVGELTLGEDDDGVTGSITDWRCPDGVTPPGPLVWPVPATSCKVKGRTTIYDISVQDFADYDLARDRLTMKGDFAVIDDDPNVPIGRVPIDLTIKAVGDPYVSSFPSADGTTLYYDELFPDAKAWGRVDGHRVSGPKVTQVDSYVGYAINDMTPVH
jgi:hypothetical protein